MFLVLYRCVEIFSLICFEKALVSSLAAKSNSQAITIASTWQLVTFCISFSSSYAKTPSSLKECFYSVESRLICEPRDLGNGCGSSISYLAIMVSSEEKSFSRAPETNEIFKQPQQPHGKNGTEGMIEPTKPVGVFYRSTSHVSGPDAFEPSSPQSPSPSDGDYHERGDEIYDRVSLRRKHIIVTVLSFCAFLSPLSSTSILAAVPEVAETYHTTGSIINVSNAAYMALMGISPVIWGPMSQVFGRRPVS